MARVRRVVTGQDAEGKSKAAAADVPCTRGRVGWHGVWGWDEAPRLPAPARAEYEPTSIFPPAGGLRVSVVEFPPAIGIAPSADPDEPAAAMFARLHDAVPPGGARDSASMVHHTETIDIGFVLSGRIVLELEAGSVTLGPGDVLVQNGTVHAWRNPWDEPCLIGMVVVRAQT